MKTQGDIGKLILAGMQNSYFFRNDGTQSSSQCIVRERIAKNQKYTLKDSKWTSLEVKANSIS